MNRGDDSMLFLFVGDGSDRERIQRRADEIGLHNVRFLPLLSPADFRGLLTASGVCLVTQLHSVSEIAFPSKIVTYLAAGCPIIASVNPECEVASIIKESGSGRVVGAEQPDTLSFAIREMRAEDLHEYGENARKYAGLRWSSVRVLGHLERSLLVAAGLATSPTAYEGGTS